MHEDILLAVLGTGDRKYEDLFRALAKDFPGRVGVKIAYDNKLRPPGGSGIGHVPDALALRALRPQPDL